MSNCLYFICPTDHLETVIEQSFNQAHYFYTSLGNSVVLNPETVGQINELVASKNIKQITFLLSRNNGIIQAALKNEKCVDIKGLCSFYHFINNHLGNLNFNQRIEDVELQLISNYLNKKVNEFSSMLNKSLMDDISINGSIYYPHDKVLSHLPNLTDLN